MNLIASITLIGWLPLVIALFAILPPRMAIVVAYLAAWLFLPNLGFSLPGLPDFTKITATSEGVLLGALIFDSGRVLSFRPRWTDAPMLAWCLCPFASSIANDLGAYDGLSAVLSTVISYGLPYFFGRVYLCESGGSADLAIGIVAGGLIYVPLCLLEMRISPQLHRFVYGAAARGDFAQSIRFGGYRPTVFMQHGLEVGMWMTSASLIAIWLWSGGTIKRLRGYPLGPLAAVLLVTAVLCKSTGAIVQMVLGLVVIWASRRFRSALPALALAAIAPLYCGVRSLGLWDGRAAVALTTSALDADRAGSLEFRLINEDMLIDKAMQRPVFGWGGWGRARVSDENGKDISVTDGLWIITLGNQGVVGLASLVAILTLPLLVLVARCPARRWKDPDVAPAAAMAVLLALYMIDNISNAMFNPIFYLIAGALLGPSSFSSGAAAPRGSGAVDPGPVAEEGRQLAMGLEAAADRGLGGWSEAEGGWWAVLGSIDGHDEATTLARADAYRHLGLCLGRLGRWREAVEAREDAAVLLAEAAAIEPGDAEVASGLAEARNDLAWLLVTADPRVRDPSRAVILAADAVKSDPSRGAYQGTLGAALIRSGRWSDGVVAIGRSLALGRGPGTPFDLLFLAMAHAGLGEHAAARDSLERATSPGVGDARPEWAAVRDEVAALLHPGPVAPRDPAPKPSENPVE